MKTIKAKVAFVVKSSIEVDENASDSEISRKLKGHAYKAFLAGNKIDLFDGVIIDCSDPSLIEADLTA